MLGALEFFWPVAATASVDRSIDVAAAVPPPSTWDLVVPAVLEHTAQSRSNGSA
jgi:hypothetical protein